MELREIIIRTISSTVLFFLGLYFLDLLTWQGFLGFFLILGAQNLDNSIRFRERKIKVRLR